MYYYTQEKTLSIDNWFGSHRSCGCVISELVLRHPLFPGRGEFDMLQKAPEPGEPGGARGARLRWEKKTWGKWWKMVDFRDFFEQIGTSWAKMMEH